VTPQQEKYLQLAQDNLKAANAIYEMGLYRIAVSRAYYAMFYAASAMLLGQGIATSRHAGVGAAFAEQFVKTGKIDREFHTNLARAQTSREIADYDLGNTISTAQVETQIQRATAFIAMATQFLTTETDTPEA
jgi:uncharacterized protein (UPF0332 family)